MLGPYYIKNNKLAYAGNKLFKPLQEVRGTRPFALHKRHIDIKREGRKWEAVIEIWNEIFRASTEFMREKMFYFLISPSRQE
jgi:aspartyl/asparaginyl-tRNA synthetase